MPWTVLGSRGTNGLTFFNAVKQNYLTTSQKNTKSENEFSKRHNERCFFDEEMLSPFENLFKKLAGLLRFNQFRTVAA